MGKRRDEPAEPTLELPSIFRRRKRRTGNEPRPAPEPDARAAAEPVRLPEPESAPAPAPVPAPQPAPAPAPAPAPTTEPTPPGRRAVRAARAPRNRPIMSAGAATLVTGLAVGVAGTGLTWAALQGCEALRGTDSCGGPGLLVLVAILALMVLLGTLLLKVQRVPEPNATSFLGVGLMTVIALVTLMESVFSAWMFLAVPVLTAVSYLAAQWVSTRFVDTEEPSPGVDVR